ncbi:MULTISPECIES: hypothetical protein [Streptomyces griseus group]|uniref:hypothetical protein n=1 Tax=Streptomyces griseus group TaxID=629295 RepID=UPI002E103684|nr:MULTISPECIES: hypothetical protein [Streptomyces griseus group]WSI46083.1 hypothetical protein OG366_00445 [Streptomyces cyaneofuscatus]WSI52664.1 hypothetical protein OG366_36720 [Streptomyces cyaneofuscatus]
MGAATRLLALYTAAHTGPDGRLGHPEDSGLRLDQVSAFCALPPDDVTERVLPLSGLLYAPSALPEEAPRAAAPGAASGARIASDRPVTTGRLAPGVWPVLGSDLPSATAWMTVEALVKLWPTGAEEVELIHGVIVFAGHFDERDLGWTTARRDPAALLRSS